MHVSLTALIVSDYDEAIKFFVDGVGFELVEDRPEVSTHTGQPKRWVVVRPPGAATGVLLAKAAGAEQSAIVGKQFAGRVGFFLQVDNFDAQYQRMLSAGVRFAEEPRHESFGTVAVWFDLAGNRWDLLGPPPR